MKTVTDINYNITIYLTISIIIASAYPVSLFSDELHHNKTISQPMVIEIFRERFKGGNQYALLDSSGTLTYLYRYEYVGMFRDGLALALMDRYVDPNWHYINTNGEIVLTIHMNTINNAWSFSQGYARIEVNDRYGYINTNGNFRIVPQYDDALDFSEGVAAVKIGETWGFIDTTFSFIIEPKYDGAKNFSGGIAAVAHAYKDWGYIDKNGNDVFNQRFYRADDFTEGYAVVEEDSYDSYGFIDKTGKYLATPQFRVARPFSDGMAAVQIIGKEPFGQTSWGFIDTTGKVAINPRFENALQIDSTLIETDIFPDPEFKNIDTQVGYMNNEGAIVISCQFEKVGSFSEGIAPVCVFDKWGYIDKRGKFVISPIYYVVKAHSFKNGIALLEASSYHYYINKSGDKIDFANLKPTP